MRDAAFVKACSLIERFRKESQHWRKLVYQVSDEQSAANKALTDIAKHCGMKSWTIPQLVESVGLALAERDSLAGTYSLMQRDHEDGVLGDPAALQEALSKMTKERDAQSALVAKQRHLLAAKQTEIGALEAERDDLRKIVEMVHVDLGIQRGDHVGEAISELKKEASDATARQRMTEVRALKYSAQAEDARREIERLRSEVESLRAKLNARNAAKQEAVSARQDAVTRAEADRKRIDGLMIQVQDMRAEIERLKTPPHPVKVGEWVERTDCGYPGVPSGTKGRVIRVRGGYYDIRLGNNEHGWCFEYCTPCDPPPEASHITPEGKQTAEGALPQPGDVVRLVRVPTNDEYPHDSGRWEPNWGGIGDYMRVHYVGSNINGTRVVRAVFGLEWPLSCVEVVKGGDK